MYTSHHPCWDAKNRDGLPEECEFSYEVIRHIIEGKAIATQSSNTLVEVDPYQHDDFNLVSNVQEVSKVNEIDERIPKQLRDLMITNNVTEDDIEKAVASKGYFPLGMKVADYPQDFIEGVLVGAWNQVYQMIIELRKEIQF